MPRKRISPRYASALQKRRTLSVQRKECVLAPAVSTQQLEKTQQGTVSDLKCGGENKMTAAAAMIGMVAAIFRLAVDASGPMKTWWTALVSLVHQHSR